jgi:PAS domain S-box-containing protein
LLLGVAFTGLLAAALLVLGILALARQQHQASALVTHTLEVLVRATTLGADLATVTSEGRGFLVDRTADSRSRFEAAILRVDTDVAGLRALTADNYVQQDALDRLAPLIAARIRVLREIMQQLDAGDVQGALRSVQMQRGRMLGDQVRAAIEDIKIEEQHLLVERSQAAKHASRSLLIGVIVCGILVATTGLFAVTLHTSRARERKHLDELRRINAELEERVRIRTTDLRASKERLRESETGFRLLAEEASDMASRVAADGTRLYASPAVARIVGLSSEELMRDGILHLVHPEDRDAVAALQARLLAGAVESETLVFRIANPQRGEVWVETAARSLRDPTTGAPDGYVSVLRDVTARRQAEVALKASEARYRLLADSTSDVVTCLDLQFRRTYASPACRTVFGYEPDEMLGGQPAATMHPDDAKTVYSRVRPVVVGEADRTTVTYRARHKAGHWVWVEATIGVVRDAASGRPASLVCALRDISERQAQADELRAANVELERLARHLARARDEAERASRAKSRFLAGMSHELRTPLNGVLGYAQLWRLEGGLNAAQSARVDAMLGAGTHLLEMINCVLDLSQIEAGRVELQASEIDLDQIARACLDLVRPSAQAKGLALGLTAMPAAPRRLIVDPTRLRQVLLNLLGNAVKFTAQGSVELRL